LNGPLIFKAILYVTLFITTATTCYFWISSGLVGETISSDDLWFVASATLSAAAVGGGLLIYLVTSFVELWEKPRWLYPLAGSLATFGMTALLDGSISSAAWIFGTLVGGLAGILWWWIIGGSRGQGEQIA
jgi:hypothetical protein